MAERIGVTTRVVTVPGRDERRDCLAADWAVFLGKALPGVRWLPVPNLGEDVVSFVEGWSLDGFILTGGEDIGTDARRDTTEAALLTLALARGLPVFGVCRGLQMIQRFFGGSLTRCAPGRHAGSRHSLTVIDDTPLWSGIGPAFEVNSFHGLGVPRSEVAPGLAAFAISEDGLAEGIYSPNAPVLAVQWHPERGAVAELDRRLVRRVLGSERGG